MRSAVELEQPVLAAVVARDPPRRGDRHLGRLRRQLAALEACRQLGDLRVRGVGELDAGVDRASHQGQRLRGNGEVSPWAFAESRPIRGDRTAMAAPVVSEGASMPGGVRLEWAQPEEPDYAHTQVTTRDPGAQDDRTWTVKGTYFERYFETLPVPPVSQQYAVRHVDRSGNASVAETVAAAPPAVVDRVGVIRDSVYLAQAPGGSPPSAPHDIDGSSGWTRKPVAPTSALPVVWQAYREANLDRGEPRLVGLERAGAVRGRERLDRTRLHHPGGTPVPGSGSNGAGCGFGLVDLCRTDQRCSACPGAPALPGFFRGRLPGLGRLRPSLDHGREEDSRRCPLRCEG